MSLHTYLIDKKFLSTFLSEESDWLSDEFASLTLKENVSISDVSDFMIKLENADVSDEIKASFLERLSRVYNEGLDNSLNEDVSIFNEYAGNPEKNKALLQLMKEMEKNLQEFYDDTLVGVKALDQILDICKKEASKKDFSAKQAAVKVKGVYDKIDKEFTAANGRKRTYGVTFNKLKKVCNSFGVKFNDVVMEDKKVFDQKLKQAHDKMANNKVFLNWLPDKVDYTTPAIKELNGYLDTLCLDSRDATSNMVRSYIQPVYNYMYMCMVGYMGNIKYLRRILGIEREDSMLYKAINKIFKTKKED